MKPILYSFIHMLKSIRRDMMLFAACLAPLLAGAAIKYVIPFIEKVLISQIGLSAVIRPYYGLFDIIFSMISPTMFCFVAAMVLLEEHDDHIEIYL